MTRIVVGNRDGALALAQARSVVADLTGEWPDINFVQRTIQAGPSAGDTTALLQALERNQLSIAVVMMERLPLTLPDGLVLASVTRRLEARSTLLAKGQKQLSELPAGLVTGVPAARDEMFLRAAQPGLGTATLTGGLDDSLKRMAEGEFGALVLPASAMMVLDRRSSIEALLDPEIFPPAVGQGSLGLIVREQDDAALELAYTLQHRPSFDRITAERSFAAALTGETLAGIASQGSVPAIGALATVTGDGELTLFGAVVAAGGVMLQATTSGEAGEAADLGQELAQDFAQQLARLG